MEQPERLVDAADILSRPDRSALRRHFGPWWWNRAANSLDIYHRGWRPAWAAGGGTGGDDSAGLWWRIDLSRAKTPTGLLDVVFHLSAKRFDRTGRALRCALRALEEIAKPRHLIAAERDLCRLRPRRAARRPIPADVRAAILRRDRHACHYCGGRAPDVVLQIDHIVPVSRGGSNDPGNLVAACVECNQGRSNRYTVRRGERDA